MTPRPISIPAHRLALSALAFLLLLTLGALPTLASSSISPDELAARRAGLASQLGPDSVLLLFSPPPAHRNGDVDWPFRQGDNLYYLTGIDEPDTTLVLLPGEAEHPEILLARDRDPRTEVWNGRIPSHEEVSEVSGISEVISNEQLAALFATLFEGSRWGESDLYRYYRAPGLPHVTRAVREGRATVWLLLEDRPGPGESLTPELLQAQDLRRRFPELSFRNATPLLEAMREVKSPAEIALLQRAVDVTVEAQIAGMHRALTATHEHQVQATIEFVFRDRGACCWGYESIVAAGANSTTLHYVSNEDPIPRDGLMLFDVGADVGHYTADITRTFPVSGTFNPQQKEVYQAVLRAWTEVLAVMRPGKSLKEAHLKALEVLGQELLKLGLVTEATQKQTELYFFHGVGHPLGMAVHDVFDRTRPFEPGMVVTNEPGLYVRPEDVRASEIYQGWSDEERTKVDEALQRYGGIGVRIEDDVLITEGEPVVLSDTLPRTVEAIESLLRQGR